MLIIYMIFDYSIRNHYDKFTRHKNDFKRAFRL
jgi:hypothetical protein